MILCTVGKIDYGRTTFGIQTLKLIEKQIDKYFDNQRVGDDICLIINAMGFSDGIPVLPNTYYYGENILNVEYYNYDDKNFQNKKNMDFIHKRTILNNENIAILRAYFLANKLNTLYPKSKMLIIAKESEEIGPQYRGCDLQIQVVNAFKKQYDELGWGSKKLIDWGWVK